MREYRNEKYTAFCRQCQNEIKYVILIHFMHITHFAGSFLPLACYLVTFCYILRFFVQMSSIFLIYLYIFCLIFFYPSFFLLLSFFFIHNYAYFMYIFTFICIKITFLKVFSFYYCINIKNGV